MFKHKRKLFINDAKTKRVRTEIAAKKMRGSSVEESAPNEWLRSFNALMRTTLPDFNRFLKSSS